MPACRRIQGIAVDFASLQGHPSHVDAMNHDAPPTAITYRMVMPGHVCPYGLKTVSLLRRKGYRVDDRWLRSREETDAFKREHDVETTPQTFIDGARIGGYDAVREWFGLAVGHEGARRYVPVLVVFAVAALLAMAVGWAHQGALLTVEALRGFFAFGMSLLALLKLQDVERFSTMFLNYDLLARRFVPYAYAYPFAELLAGVLMAADALPWLSAPVALVIGTVGAVSVFKAVYIEKRELKCACVGGDSDVPLGFISLTENLVMIGMGIWMGWRAFVA